MAYGPASSREDFGLLVAALRKTQFATPMSQESLASRAGINKRMLVRIEAGNPGVDFLHVSKEDETEEGGQSVITGLMNAFSLSFIERREFAHAALLHDREYTLSPDEALKAAETRLGQLSSPAFAIDEAGMMVMANDAVVKLHAMLGVPSTAILLGDPKTSEDTLRHSIVRWLLDPVFDPINDRLLPSRREVLVRVARQLKLVGLRYRHTARLQGMLAHFLSDPRFRIAWEVAVSGVYRSDVETDGDNFALGFRNPIADLPDLQVQSMSAGWLTAHGDLRVFALVPSNQMAMQVFSGFPDTPKVHQLGRWPFG